MPPTGWKKNEAGVFVPPPADIYEQIVALGEDLDAANPPGGTRVAVAERPRKELRFPRASFVHGRLVPRPREGKRF